MTSPKIKLMKLRPKDRISGAELKSMLADSPIVLCRKELLDQVNLSLIWLCNQTDLADFQVCGVTLCLSLDRIY